MRNAQRVILSFLLGHQGSPSKTRLVKMAFLVAQELPEGERGPFYDFLPYKYGPFSFALYRDLNELARDGWIRGDEDLEILKTRKTEAAEEVEKMPVSLREGVAKIERRFSRVSDHHLIKIIYDRYPRFTYFSELKAQSSSPPVAPISIYTIGYEGTSVDGFLNACIQHGIKQILDVRNNPWSRKWGFTKNALAEFCSKVGIEYRHLPELGVPQEQRENLSTPASRRALLNRYEKAILPRHQEAMGQALRLIRTQPTALLCVEADANSCHRSRLAQALARNSGLPVHHLEAR